MAKYRQQQRNKTTLLASFLGQAGTVFFLFGVEEQKNYPRSFPHFYRGKKRTQKSAAKKKRKKIRVTYTPEITNQTRGEGKRNNRNFSPSFAGKQKGGQQMKKRHLLGVFLHHFCRFGHNFHPSRRPPMLSAAGRSSWATKERKIKDEW